MKPLITCPLCSFVADEWSEFARHMDAHADLMHVPCTKELYWRCPCGEGIAFGAGGAEAFARHYQQFHWEHSLAEHLILAAIASVGR